MNKQIKGGEKMKKTIMPLIALLLTTSCAGVQTAKAPDTVTPTAPVVQAPNYSGTWTGSFDMQGQAVTLILTLVHEGGKVTGTISDGQGQMGSTEIANPVLKDKVLTFSIILTTPQGAMPINFTDTFSEDNKESSLYFEVSGMQFNATANLKKS
jgi:hypothetical protein